MSTAPGCTKAAPASRRVRELLRRYLAACDEWSANGDAPDSENTDHPDYLGWQARDARLVDRWYRGRRALISALMTSTPRIADHHCGRGPNPIYHRATVDNRLLLVVNCGECYEPDGPFDVIIVDLDTAGGAA